MAAACATQSPSPAPEPARSPTGDHAHHGGGAAPSAAAGARASADARFLQHMIPHHAQALVMTSLVPGRTQRPEIRLMAERIAVSQRDEIAQMRSWLEARGADVPALDTVGGAPAGHAAHGGAAAGTHAAMPGM